MTVVCIPRLKSWDGRCLRKIDVTEVQQVSEGVMECSWRHSVRMCIYVFIYDIENDAGLYIDIRTFEVTLSREIEEQNSPELI